MSVFEVGHGDSDVSIYESPLESQANDVRDGLNEIEGLAPEGRSSQ